MSDYKCILPFDDQSPSFTYGFQAGRIWSLLLDGEPFEETFCGDILDLVQRMQTRFEGLVEGPMKIDKLADDWYTISLD